MNTKYKNILLQGWMFDPLEFMEKEEQDKYKLALIDSALTGDVQTDNPKWVRFIEKALSSIEETRAKYYAKAKKNGEKCEKNAEFGILGKKYGIQGKEYGIQGKEYGILGKEYGILGKKYGKLGGRPRKGETKEQYKERKRLENEALYLRECGD